MTKNVCTYGIYLAMYGISVYAWCNNAKQGQLWQTYHGTALPIWFWSLKFINKFNDVLSFQNLENIYIFYIFLITFWIIFPLKNFPRPFSGTPLPFLTTLSILLTFLYLPFPPHLAHHKTHLEKVLFLLPLNKGAEVERERKKTLTAQWKLNQQPSPILSEISNPLRHSQLSIIAYGSWSSPSFKFSDNVPGFSKTMEPWPNLYMRFCVT